MNEYMYEQRVCVFTQATYTTFAFNDCSFVEEELQGREMPFLGGDRQSGTATLTETIQNHISTHYIHSWPAPYRPSLNAWPKQQYFTHIHIDNTCIHLLCVFALGCPVQINTRSKRTLHALHIHTSEYIHATIYERECMHVCIFSKHNLTLLNRFGYLIGSFDVGPCEEEQVHYVFFSQPGSVDEKSVLPLLVRKTNRSRGR